jgi:pilus assembly protein CpaD
MTRTSLFLRASVAAIGLLAAACDHVTNGPEAAFNPVTRFPIAVEPRMATMRIPYDGPRMTADPNTAAQLERFAKDYLDRGTGSIAVSATRRNPQAASEIADRLVALGIPRARIMVGNQDTADGSNDVRINYIRYEAQAPSCGDWSTNLAETSANLTSPNFGCATQKNLAAMVADPRDLVSPRPLDPDDAQRRLTVLEKYRKGETTVAEKAASQSGAVTAVAQGGGM